MRREKNSSPDPLDNEPPTKAETAKTIQDELTPTFWGSGSSQAHSFIKKILLLGEPAVGKTSLVRRFVYDIFDDEYISSIGVKITRKNLVLSAGENPSSSGSAEINFLIWDLEGQKGRGELNKSYCAGAEGALVVCDVTRRETLDALTDWITDLCKAGGLIPLLFLVNKSDLKEEAVLTEDDIKEFASKYHASYLFTSAKTGNNVETAFKNMGQLLLKEKK